MTGKNYLQLDVQEQSLFCKDTLYTQPIDFDLFRVDWKCNFVHNLKCKIHVFEQQRQMGGPLQTDRALLSCILAWHSSKAWSLSAQRAVLSCFILPGSSPGLHTFSCTSFQSSLLHSFEQYCFVRHLPHLCTFTKQIHFEILRKMEKKRKNLKKFENFWKSGCWWLEQGTVEWIKNY